MKMAVWKVVMSAHVRCCGTRQVPLGSQAYTGSCCYLYPCNLPVSSLYSDPENGGSILLRNVFVHSGRTGHCVDGLTSCRDVRHFRFLVCPRKFRHFACSSDLIWPASRAQRSGENCQLIVGKERKMANRITDRTVKL
jgi:hypothetical protein